MYVKPFCSCNIRNKRCLRGGKCWCKWSICIFFISKHSLQSESLKSMLSRGKKKKKIFDAESFLLYLVALTNRCMAPVGDRMLTYMYAFACWHLECVHYSTHNSSLTASSLGHDFSNQSSLRHSKKTMLTLPAIEYSFFTYNVEKQGIFDLYTRDHTRQKLSSSVP